MTSALSVCNTDTATTNASDTAKQTKFSSQEIDFSYMGSQFKEVKGDGKGLRVQDVSKKLDRICLVSKDDVQGEEETSDKGPRHGKELKLAPGI